MRRPDSTKWVTKSFTRQTAIRTLAGVSAIRSPRDRPSGGPVAPEIGFSQENRTFETAIQRSQNYLLREQRPEGYWIGELMVDSTLVSDTLAYHHWNGKVDPDWQRKAVHHIFSMQLPDGGWNIYDGGPSEVNATIKAYLALNLAGGSVTDPRLLRARQRAHTLR